MAINPTSSVNPAPYQPIQRVASANDVRISRRMTGDAGSSSTQRTVRRTETPTVGQQIDKILSKAEKALFSLLFSESDTEQSFETSVPVAPVAQSRPRSRPAGPALGQKIDIHG